MIRYPTRSGTGNNSVISDVTLYSGLESGAGCIWRKPVLAYNISEALVVVGEFSDVDRILALTLTLTLRANKGVPRIFHWSRDRMAENRSRTSEGREQGGVLGEGAASPLHTS